jgi:hypothetical protein
MSSSALDDDPPIIFYTTRTFDFGQQIRIAQSADGFLGGGIGGTEHVEDPFWSGTGRVGDGVREVPVADSAGIDSLKRPVPDGGDFVCAWLVLSSQLSITSHGLQLANGTNGDANGTPLDVPIEGQTFLALSHSIFSSMRMSCRINRLVQMTFRTQLLHLLARTIRSTCRSLLVEEFPACRAQLYCSTTLLLGNHSRSWIQTVRQWCRL